MSHFKHKNVQSIARISLQKKFPLLLMLFFSSYQFVANAQQNMMGTTLVIAKVKSKNNQPIEGATVNLLQLRTKDSVIAKVAFTDKLGIAELENIKPGRYVLKVTMVGYIAWRSDIKTIGENTGSKLDFGTIELTELSKSLGEVTVESRKPFIERKLDRMIVNVENSIVGAGSTVLDVLERSPGVTVNQETSINLKGKSGLVVMIDGKPSPLSGADLITYLKGIPSANIERIEIITNPSAKYDAAGNAGIIDIRFKRDKRQGYNGSLSLNYGQGVYRKPSASTNHNFRSKKWNLFANYSHSQPRNFTRFDINRKFFDGNRNLLSVFDQKSYIKQPLQSNNTRFGADYFVSKKTVIGVLFNFNWLDNKRNGVTSSVITKPNGQLDYTTATTNALRENRFNGFGNFNLKHTFDSLGKELTMDVDYGKFNASTLQHFDNKNSDAAGNPISGNILNTDQQGIIKVKSLKADYVNPIDKTSKFETGFKMSEVTSDNDVKFFNFMGGSNVLDPNQSNHFIYRERINAAYVNYAKQFSKTDVQLGLRLEQTSTRGEQLTTGQVFTRKYAYLFPSFFVNQKLNEKNLLSLSYSRRIDRPSYRQLNPFKIFVDPYTYVTGDPALKPVLTNSFEFSYTFKNKYVTTLSYAQSKEVITDVFQQDDVTKISYQIPANIQNFDQYSVSTTIPVSIGKWMNSNFIVSGYYNKYTSPLQGGNLVNDFTAWDANMNNSFIIGKKGWSAELSGFYQSKNAWGLFVIRNLGQVGAGIQKVSKDRKSTFRLNISDMFYTNRIAVIVKYQNMDFFTNRNGDSRAVTFSFTHRFGKSTVAQARRRNSGVEDEKRRAN